MTDRTPMPQSTFLCYHFFLQLYLQIYSYPNNGSTAANPRAPQPNQKDPNLQQEPSGAVASDSVAAESLKSGGAFADNDNAEAMGVKGASSTLNNQDTSGATTLPPAADGSAREGGDSGEQYQAGQAQFSGSHNLDGYTGGPSADRAAQFEETGQRTGEYQTSQSASGQSPSGGTSGGDTMSGGTSDQSTTVGGTSDQGVTGSSNSSSVDTAPNAYGHFRTEGEMKPKGTNLTEGNIPETKTFTGDVGGPHDPGRLAEQSMQAANADTAGSGGARQYQTGGNTGQFDVLNSERAGDQSSR